MTATVTPPVMPRPVLPGLEGSHIRTAGHAVVVEVEDGAGVEERLAVDEGLGVSEGVGELVGDKLTVDEGLGVPEAVGELDGVKLGVGDTEGEELKGTPETRIRNPDTPVGAAPAAAKATVAVKGYAAASRVTGSSVLGE